MEKKNRQHFAILSFIDIVLANKLTMFFTAHSKLVVVLFVVGYVKIYSTFSKKN